MRGDMLAKELSTIYAYRSQLPMLERGQRFGRIDTRRASRAVMAADPRIFAARRLDETETPKGSLAIVVGQIDLYSANVTSYYSATRMEQSNMWRESVKAVYEGAASIGIKVRFFATGSTRGDGRDDGRSTVYEADTLDQFWGLPARNMYTRYPAGLEKADAWHETVPGRSVTIIITQWPEMDSAETMSSGELYNTFVKNVSTECEKWSKHPFYTLGIRLDTTAERTWGNLKKNGARAHMRACFPKARRYEVDEMQDLVAAIRHIGKTVAAV